MSQIVYVTYYDVINDQKVKAFMQACAQIVDQDKPSQLNLLFSSSGGSVNAGMTLHHYLRALPIPITMHNIGIIDSIANVIFLSADERYAVPQATFLFHGIGWTFSGPQSWNQLQEAVSQFKADETKMINIISQRCSINAEELKAFFHQGECKDVAFAEQKGIIKSVREAKVPPNARLHSLNFA